MHDQSGLTRDQFQFRLVHVTILPVLVIMVTREGLTVVVCTIP